MIEEALSLFIDLDICKQVLIVIKDIPIRLTKGSDVGYIKLF